MQFSFSPLPHFGATIEFTMGPSTPMDESIATTTPPQRQSHHSESKSGVSLLERHNTKRSREQNIADISTNVTKKKARMHQKNDSTVMDPVQWLVNECDYNDSVSSTTLRFSKPNDQMIAAYDMTVMTAARTGKLEQMRDIPNLNCSNSFGETLLHFCCRRGFTDIVKFLIDERHCDFDIADDSNRNILHFACWTAEPNLELVRYLLERLPIQFALAKDVRGHTPFAYVRQEHWGIWCRMLRSNRHLFGASSEINHLSRSG